MERRAVLREMWNEACASGMAHTAYGILLDMFELWDLLESDPNSPATEHQFAGFKEDLMHILDDHDGKYLHRWREDWHDDRDVFDLRAQKRIHDCVKGLRS